MEAIRPLRRPLHLALLGVHKYSLGPARLRSHPHMTHPLHATVHSARSRIFLSAAPATIGCIPTHQLNKCRGPSRPQERAEGCDSLLRMPSLVRDPAVCLFVAPFGWKW